MADEEFMFGDLFATVRVQDLPASREVVAVERQENGTWRVCGSAIANTDGIAELGIEGSKTSRVYAFAIDHWGEPFTPNRSVAYGDIIRPSVFLGWLYRVTAPGVLPGEEPVWWNSTPGMPRPVGSAMAQAEMYFQPIAHGPVDIEWEEKGVGDPHWDKVVALLHFDGGFADETGRIWEGVNGASVVELGVFESQGALNMSTNTAKVMTLDSPIQRYDLFTIEAFIRFGAISQRLLLRPVFSQTDGGSSKQQAVSINTSTGRLQFHRQSNVGSVVTMDGVSVAAKDVWNHIALSFDGSYIRLFLNGNLEAVAANIDGWYPLGNMEIGCYTNPSSTTYSFLGDIDEVRITKDVARYTENFTPPTEPFPNFK